MPTTLRTNSRFLPPRSAPPRARPRPRLPPRARSPRESSPVSLADSVCQFVANILVSPSPEAEEESIKSEDEMNTDFNEMV